MAESESHKRAKGHAAGRSGETEVPLSGNRRLDAATDRKAVEVERSGQKQRLIEAAQRLAASGKPQHVLIVPDEDRPAAIQAMRQVGVGGTVKNLTGTKRQYVPPRKK